MSAAAAKFGGGREKGEEARGEGNLR
jgi:hypothetical protein